MDNINWSQLDFGYIKTDYNVRSYWRDGKWGEMELSQDDHINIHMAATALHYGQEAFEGLKAFRGKDGKVRIFRPRDNAKRMITTAEYVVMQHPSEEMFVEAVEKVVRANERFVPPYGTGASLYIRPLLIGTGPQIGVRPANEYLFLVLVTPVGPYYKEGFNPINAIIDRDHDRAAPNGTGHIKVGGNYAASLASGRLANQQGYASVLYLDAREKKYIDECGAANFFAIKDNTYITPKSSTILPSITNMSLMSIAEDIGLKVERRAVELSELESFEEAGACGTAAVISPIGEIYDPKQEKKYIYNGGKKAGEWSVKLYEALRAIQLGEAEDKHGWNLIVE